MKSAKCIFVSFHILYFINKKIIIRTVEKPLDGIFIKLP